MSTGDDQQQSFQHKQPSDYNNDDDNNNNNNNKNKDTDTHKTDENNDEECCDVNDEEDEEEEVCPICLTPPSVLKQPLTSGQCQHNVCQPCMERVLLTPHPTTSHYQRNSDTGQEEEDGDAYLLYTPTLGKCPICRSQISLFELKNVKSGKVLYEKDMNVENWDIGGMVFSTKKDGVGFGSFHFPPQVKKRKKKLSKKKEGVNGISNDGQTRDMAAATTTKGTEEEEEEENGNSLPPLPYLSFESLATTEEEEDENIESTASARRKKWKFDDGMSLPERLYFEKGCHYHTMTRTFHGTIVWSKDDTKPRYQNSHKWDIILQFNNNPDFRFVNSGVIIKHRDDEVVKQTTTTTTGSTTSSSTNNTHQEQKRKNLFPLDGRYKVFWHGQHEGTTERINVISNEYTLYDFHYTIDVFSSTNRTPRFIWPQGMGEYSGTIQSVVSGLNLDTNPDGPDVGEEIVWRTDHTEYEKITWVRETIGPPPPPKIERLGPQYTFYERSRIIIPSSTNIDTSSSGIVANNSIPRYHGDGPWGNIFIQSYKVGFASYHFFQRLGGSSSGEEEEEEEGVQQDDDNEHHPYSAYISYEHPLCSQWPPLDNGTPIPSRVPFQNISYNATTRTFRGTINWYDTYHTTWQNCKVWYYEMIFDSEFSCIVSGYVRATNSVANRRQEGEEEVMEDVESDISTFGENLVYVNAAIMEKFRSELSVGGEEELEEVETDNDDGVVLVGSDDGGGQEEENGTTTTGENEYERHQQQQEGSTNATVATTSSSAAAAIITTTQTIADSTEEEEEEEDDEEGSSSTMSNFSDYIRFTVQSQNLRHRLEQEGATPRTIGMLHRLLVSTQQQPEGGQSNHPIIDYNTNPSYDFVNMPL